MAAGAAVLVRMLWLWSCLLPEPGMSQEDEKEDRSPASAPPELLALVPAEAKATVAAGYINSTSEDVITAATSPQTEASPLTVSVSEEPEVTPKKRATLPVGDDRYAWQDWSTWHCNCEEGTMSRVRDITYSVPGVHLDPVQYDVLRFEREACSYSVCDCSLEEHECDRRVVTCKEGPMHLCALKDIEKDHDQKRKEFWFRVHQELRNLWQSLKDTFPLQ